MAFAYAFSCPYCGDYAPDVEEFLYTIEIGAPEALGQEIVEMLHEDENLFIHLIFDAKGCFQCNTRESERHIKPYIEIATERITSDC